MFLVFLGFVLLTSWITLFIQDQADGLNCGSFVLVKPATATKTSVPEPTVAAKDEPVVCSVNEGFRSSSTGGGEEWV